MCRTHKDLRPPKLPVMPWQHSWSRMEKVSEWRSTRMERERLQDRASLQRRRRRNVELRSRRVIDPNHQLVPRLIITQWARERKKMKNHSTVRESALTPNNYTKTSLYLHRPSSSPIDLGSLLKDQTVIVLALWRHQWVGRCSEVVQSMQILVTTTHRQSNSWPTKRRQALNNWRSRETKRCRCSELDRKARISGVVGNGTQLRTRSSLTIWQKKMMM